MLGMLIEPLWVVIGMHVCMVWPYQTLQLGQALASKSLTPDFDKTPPHFQFHFPRSGGNMNVSVVATAILLANLLAVAFGGLFSPGTATVTSITNITRFQQPTILAGMVVVDSRSPQNIYFQNDMYYLLLGSVLSYVRLPKWTTPEFYIFPFNNTRINNESVSQQGTSWGFGASISCELLSPDQLSSRTIQSGNYSLDIQYPCSPNTTFISLDASSPTTGFLLSGSCPESFFGIWAELPADPKPANLTNPYLDQAEYVALACNSSLTIAELLVSVDLFDNVLGNEVINPKVPPIVETSQDGYMLYLDPNIVWTFHQFINSPSRQIIGQRDDGSQPLSWINTLMTRVRPEIRRDPTTLSNLPNTTHLEETFEDIYRSLFAIFIQLYGDLMFRSNLTQKSQGSENITQDRVDVSTPMFGIAVSILTFFIIAVLYIYLIRPARPVCHRPTTLAATHTLLYASNALEDISMLRGRNSKERGEKLEALGHRYGYGSFVGTDRRGHFGVYKEVSAFEKSGGEQTGLLS